MQTANPPVRWRQSSDRVLHMRRLHPALIGKHLDDSILARHQKARPVGRDLAPELHIRPFADEGAFSAKALDQSVIRQKVKRLPNCGPRDTAFGGQFVDRGNLLPDRPLPGIYSSPEQTRKLDVASHGAAIEIRRCAYMRLHLLHRIMRAIPQS